MNSWLVPFILTALVSYCAGFIIGSTELENYADKSCLYSIGQAIESRIPGFDHWLLCMSVRLHSEQHRDKTTYTETYGCAVVNYERLVLEGVALLAMILWFVSSFVVWSVTYGTGKTFLTEMADFWE